MLQMFADAHLPFLRLFFHAIATPRDIEAQQCRWLERPRDSTPDRRTRRPAQAARCRRTRASDGAVSGAIRCRGIAIRFIHDPLPIRCPRCYAIMLLFAMPI